MALLSSNGTDFDDARAIIAVPFFFARNARARQAP
jgi:hypothetical protein